MCENCDIIKTLFEAAQDNRHANYLPVLNFLIGMEEQKRIELYAGDCALKDAEDILCGEKMYTVKHYLKCTKCGQLFFLGACIRGTPIFELTDRVPDGLNYWNGHIGTKYNGPQL